MGTPFIGQWPCSFPESTMNHICKNTGKTVALAVLAALSLSACATTSESRSQKIAEKAQERFSAADSNHDGYLSRDEASAGTPRLAAHFDEIDSNGDGQLSKEEILAYLKQRRGSR
jgi:Ca2+-binding EF-hand superfamily protein